MVSGQNAGTAGSGGRSTGSQPRIIRVYHVTCVASQSFSLFVFSQGAYSKSVLGSLEDVRAHSPEIARRKIMIFQGIGAQTKEGRENH